MKAQEEINQILLGKIHRDEEEEDNKSNEHKEEHVTLSYKKGGRKLHFPDNYRDNSSDNSVKLMRHKRDSKKIYKRNYSSDNSESSPPKRRHKPYEELSREFKKIKPPTFNGEVESGEEAEAWLSGMRKYFHIYNYSDRLKSRMAIYNLTGKADIWWEDLKRVKKIK